MRYGNARQYNWTWTIVCSCLSMWAATKTWGDDAAKPPVGLNGLLATAAPAGLTEDDFKDMADSIDQSWKSWTIETGDLVKSWYEGDHTTLEAQQAELNRLKAKVGTLKKALSDNRYRAIFPQLSRLYSRLEPEVHIAEAVLNSLTHSEVDAQKARLTPALAQVRTATANLQNDLRGFRNAKDWQEWANVAGLSKLTPESTDVFAVVTAVKTKMDNTSSYAPAVQEFLKRDSFTQLEAALDGALKASSDPVAFDSAALRESYAKLLGVLAEYRTQPTLALEGEIRKLLEEIRSKSPDGGDRFANVLSRHYTNYNLRLVVTEGMINRLFQETRLENGLINERTSEANIRGYQCTRVTSRLDLVPNSLTASFRLTLSGIVTSRANGYTSQATIGTVGSHSFSASKFVNFDGVKFTSTAATVSASSNNQAVSARTRYSGMPLFGRIADNVAMREASERVPQSNATSAQRIRQQVGAELESESNKQLAKATSDLEAKTYARLRKFDLYPDVLSLSTTDNELMVYGRVMGSKEIAGSAPFPITNVPANGMVAQIHESLLSHSFDRLGLNGKELTEDQAREELSKSLTDLFGRSVTLKKPEAAETDAELQANVLVFDKEDAVRFQIENDVVTIQIRAGLKRENGEEIPTQIITVPFTPSLANGKVVLTRGNVGVRPVTRPPNVAAQVARAQIMRRKIQSALPELTFDNTFEVKREGKIVRLQLVDLSAQGGWLQLALK
ncbi:hypothetical protein [Planctomicrobium sp. SH527]|uniref:hypothetical protein n=1 Tax=Planctomicrobium sp. SH527 TaxID=3448123 RepID=UPI003F5C20A4